MSFTPPFLCSILDPTAAALYTISAFTNCSSLFKVSNSSVRAFYSSCLITANISDPRDERMSDFIASRSTFVTSDFALVAGWTGLPGVLCAEASGLVLEELVHLYLRRHAVIYNNDSQPASEFITSLS